MSLERETIDPKKIVLSRRWTKLEYEAHQAGIAVHKLVDMYEKDEKRATQLASHFRQLENFDNLMELLGNPHYTVGENIKREDFAGADLIGIEGGDGHATFGSHFIKDEKVIFIVADKLLSKAALYDFDVDSLREIYPLLLRGEYFLEGWTRLKAVIDGVPIPELGLSDIAIGAKSWLDMSKYTIKYRGVTEEHKTSGILVSTGTGSTGWGRKLSALQMGEDRPFPRTDLEARFIVMDEPLAGLSEYYTVNGMIEPGENLELVSHADMLISPDSYKNLVYDFPFGSKAVIGLANQPLRVIRSFSSLGGLGHLGK